MIPKGLSIFVYNGFPVALPGSGFPVRSMWRINGSGNGWLGFIPGMPYPGIQGLQRDGFYLVDADEAFVLKDAQTVVCVGTTLPTSANIPSGMSLFLYAGPTINISSTPWVNSVDYLYRINDNGTGWIGYEPGFAYSAFTTLEPGQFYFILASSTFALAGAQVVACPELFGEETFPIDMSPFVRKPDLLDQVPEVPVYGTGPSMTLFKQIIDGLVLGGGGAVTEDILVSHPDGYVGGWDTGNTVASGTVMTEVFKKLFRRAAPIAYAQPTATLATVPNPGEFEAGTELNISLSASFFTGDSGGLTGWQIYRGAVQIATTSTALVSLILAKATETFFARASYSEGTAKADSLGNLDPNDPNRIMAGAVDSPSLIFVGAWYIYFGPTATVPADGYEARALPQSRSENAGNVFNLNTGNTQTRFALVLPPGKVLQQVVDLDALQQVITVEYALVNGNFTGRDAAGNAITGCKLYVKQQSVAYSTSHRHQITIANG